MISTADETTLATNHLAIHTLAALGMVVLTPRVLWLAYWGFQRFVIGLPVAKPDLTYWPYVPSGLFLAVFLSLLTFNAPTRVRLMALGFLAVSLGLSYGYFDLRSVLPFTALVASTFILARLPVRRMTAAAAITFVSLGLLIACGAWLRGAAITTVLSIQFGLLPMLWYSMYEHRAVDSPLPFRRVFVYLSTRFFGAPVLQYRDVFVMAEDDQLAQVRLAGVRTIYIALFASIAAAAAKWVDIRAPSESLTGLRLLAASYISYVGYYCWIVVRVNLFLGILRLFGIPVRNNFEYWLLARTPNEHWKRWNLMSREWLLTFVFFPIMRAKRSLFAAVMASLCVSGLLHAVPSMLARGMSMSSIVANAVYWLANGFAIYVVLRIPQIHPRLIARLRIRDSLVWSAVGIILTSAFYAVLHGLRSEAETWAQLAGYVTRLTTL